LIASSGALLVEALERSSGRGGSIVDDTEAVLVTKVVDSLVKCGLPPSSVGEACPFRTQLYILDECLTLKQLTRLEISSIDRYQGRDKPAIVFSFVRSYAKYNNVLMKLTTGLSRAMNAISHFYSYYLRTCKQQAGLFSDASITAFWLVVYFRSKIRLNFMK
jgi:hypothetical protein